MSSQKKIKIFADGADIDSIRRLSENKNISGFTTNPTLMRKAGIVNYEDFAKELLGIVSSHPVSFEVFADDFEGMTAQGLRIASWGRNVNVKVPITTTKGEFTGPVISTLSNAGVVVNVTAITTVQQVQRVAECLSPETAAIVSVFAGRIADTGRDPCPIMTECLEILSPRPKAELLWASPRELLNIIQAQELGCHIITVTPDLLAKMALIGKDLDQYSLETVEMFFRDASAAGYKIDTTNSQA